MVSFENFTDDARKSMALADQEAKRFNHVYIGTEHILLGIVKEGAHQGALVLQGFKVFLRDVRLQVEKQIKSGVDMVTVGKLPRNQHADLCLEKAVENSNELGHQYVGQEHLLLAIADISDCLAVEILMQLNVQPAVLRAEILRSLGQIDPRPYGAVAHTEPNGVGLDSCTFRNRS
jgi:ATP-dependent Clp protease ATP-binding subunit ClpC